MTEFMLTVFLGNLFAMAIVILLIGFMFVLRVMLNVWFDTDFMRTIVAWFKNTDRKLKEKEKEYEDEQNTLLIVDDDEDRSECDV